MASMSEDAEAQASTDPGQLVNDLLRGCSASALHLELRDSYTPGDPWLRSWLDGDRREFERRLNAPVRPWLDLIREVTGHGVAVLRLRVVSEPVSDYIRFEYDTSVSNVAAGEQVRWLARRRAADLLLPGCDCWIFDKRRVVSNVFDGPGEWVSTDLREDAVVAERLAAAFMSAWERGVPHADYRLS
jgi:hypothetical protein